MSDYFRTSTSSPFYFNGNPDCFPWPRKPCSRPRHWWLLAPFIGNSAPAHVGLSFFSHLPLHPFLPPFALRFFLQFLVRLSFMPISALYHFLQWLLYLASKGSFTPHSLLYLVLIFLYSLYQFLKLVYFFCVLLTLFQKGKKLPVHCLPSLC